MWRQQQQQQQQSNNNNLTKSRIGNLTRLILILAMCDVLLKTERGK